MRASERLSMLMKATTNASPNTAISTKHMLAPARRWSAIADRPKPRGAPAYSGYSLMASQVSGTHTKALARRENPSNARRSPFGR